MAQIIQLIAARPSDRDVVVKIIDGKPVRYVDVELARPWSLGSPAASVTPGRVYPFEQRAPAGDV